MSIIYSSGVRNVRIRGCADGSSNSQVRKGVLQVATIASATSEPTDTIH